MHLGQSKKLNIYTYSKYAYHALYSHASIWKEVGLFTSQGSPTKHSSFILYLIEADQVPAQVAVIHCRGHQRTQFLEAIGNDADQEAQQAANLPYPHSQATAIPYLSTQNPVYNAQEIQALLSQEATWEGPWLLIQEKYILSNKQKLDILKNIHSSLHIRAIPLKLLLSPIFHIPSLSTLI
jgi:hypothetical protein